jgi:hypothetical protein
MIEELGTVDEIKAAVDAGADVRAGSDAYRVIRDNIGQYLIHYTGHPENWIGLHGREGTEFEKSVNMRPVYIKKKAITIQWGEDPRDHHEMTYHFNTSAEISAFRTGIQEAMGWGDFEIVYTDEEL